MDLDRRAAIGALLAASGAAAAPVASAGLANADTLHDVVVIGAGLAGLTAAWDLLRAGNRRFVVLEARDRVGGRTFNHQLGGGRISEAGGQWIGPGQTAVADLARELDIGTFDSDFTGKGVMIAGNDRVMIDQRGEIVLDPALVRDIEALARTVPPAAPWTAPDAARLDAMTVAQYLANRGVHDFDLFTMQVGVLETVGTTTGHASLLHFLALLSVAGGINRLEGQRQAAQQTRFVGGSQALSLRLAELLGDHVVRNAPVSAIHDWQDNGVSVVTPRGVFRAREVIMALSPPLCGRIAFAPALPRQRAALQARWPAFAPLCKSAMVYDRPFWFDAGFNGQVASPDGPVIWSYDNSPPDKAFGVINAFLRVGELDADPDAARRQVADIYARAMGDDRLRAPSGFHVLDWGQEPYTLSCISPMPPGFLTSGLMPALAAPCGHLHWAGSETGGIWAGYMDGAVRSGHRAALQALQALGGAA